MATIKRRVLSDGSVRWRLQVFLARDENGKRKFYTKTYDRKKDAEKESRRLEGLKDGGALLAPSREPLGAYLRRWLDEVKKGQLRARTYADYSGTLRRYIEEPPEECPPLRLVRLDRLTPDALQSLYSWLQEEEGLSPRTIRSLHAVVRQGLAHAARVGAAPRNVADLVVLPKQQKRKVGAMSEEEATRFLEAAREDRYWPLWCVLLTGGLRPGEATALRWEDLELDQGRIHVQRTLTRRGVDGWKLAEPKTDRARRVVVLPTFAVEALREWKRKQAEEKLLLGPEYEDNGFVFATPFGKPLDGANLYARNFNRIMAAAGLGEWEGEPQKPEGQPGPRKKRKFRPAYRLYDLRHTCATRLLRAGLNPKVVSERLGHASVAFTMDVYAASLPDMQEEAAEKLEAMFGAGG